MCAREYASIIILFVCVCVSAPQLPAKPHVAQQCEEVTLQMEKVEEEEEEEEECEEDDRNSVFHVQLLHFRIFPVYQLILYLVLFWRFSAPFGFSSLSDMRLKPSTILLLLPWQLFQYIADSARSNSFAVRDRYNWTFLSLFGFE